MVLGCGIPLLFILLVPALGIGGGNSLFTFIVLMFAIHLLMPMHHGGHDHSSRDNEKENKDHHH